MPHMSKQSNNLDYDCVQIGSLIMISPQNRNYRPLSYRTFNFHLIAVQICDFLAEGKTKAYASICPGTGFIYHVKGVGYFG